MNVKVSIAREENANYFGVDIGSIVTIDLEQYVAGVVASEMGETFLEALKAQAVAARTYVMPYVEKDTIVTDDSSKNQAFRATRMNWSGAKVAAKETEGIVLYYNGKLINTCSYSSSNGGRMKSSEERWGGVRAWLISKEDPWDKAYTELLTMKGKKPLLGHGIGMSQYGAMYAAEIGYTYKEILMFYYQGTTLFSIDKGVIEMVSAPKFGTRILDKNDCYTKGRKIIPKGIVVHATGADNSQLKRYVGPDDGVLGQNTNGNHWNKPGFDKCGNAFIGKVQDGSVMIYQTLPWDQRPWLSGSGPKGNANNTHIQFEICQDFAANTTAKANVQYWAKCRQLAVHLCAWWCQMFNIDVVNVISHKEAAKAGIASNHSDPENWMVLFGDNMDKFRADVQKMLNGEDGGEKPMQDSERYIGTVSGSGYLNVRNSPEKILTPDNSIGKLSLGTKVEVIGPIVSGNYAPIQYPQQPAFVDTSFLSNRIPVIVLPPEVVEREDDDPEDVTDYQVPEGYVLVKKEDLEKLLIGMNEILNG